MKRVCIRLLAVFLMLCLCTAGGSAAEEETEAVYVENVWNYVDGSMDVSHGIPENAGGVLARIRSRGRLLVATNPDWAPQEFIDPDKSGQARFAGADMELARRIAERMGVELRIVEMDFSEVLEATAEDTCDLAISALAFTPGRASLYELSKGYYFAQAPASTTLIIRQEDAENIRSLEDLADKILVVQSGTLQESLGAEHVLRYLEYRRIGSPSLVYQQVEKGEADAGLVDIETAMEYIENNPDAGLMLVDSIQFALDRQYQGDRVAGKKGELELLYFVNGVIDEVVESGEYMHWIEEAEQRARELDL